MSLWQETIHGGASWALLLRRGNTLRLEDTEGGANVGALFFNKDFPAERYNMSDTLKGQHTAHLTTGFILVSDMGRVMCSITADSCGWHDPLGGHNDAGAVAAKYGFANYQKHRNDWHRNTCDNFVIEAEKYGLDVRDIGPNVNFFSKVVVESDGGMGFIAGNSKAGDYVDLRAEMDLLVILDTNQHPLDANPKYEPKPIKFSVSKSSPVAPNDFCRTSHPENERAFINTDRYFL